MLCVAFCDATILDGCPWCLFLLSPQDKWATPIDALSKEMLFVFPVELISCEQVSCDVPTDTYWRDLHWYSLCELKSKSQLQAILISLHIPTSSMDISTCSIKINIRQVWRVSFEVLVCISQIPTRDTDNYSMWLLRFQLQFAINLGTGFCSSF